VYVVVAAAVSVAWMLIVAPFPVALVIVGAG
jgi:hypothetical protein